MRLLTRGLAVLALVLAAIVGGLASPASAAPVTYTQTTLNLGLRLTYSNAGTVIASDPATNDVGQRWIEPLRGITVNGEVKFGYEIKPSGNSAYCITDMGANQRVQVKSCSGAATQVWQWIDGRTVSGKSFKFWVNAQTGGKLMFDTFTNEGPFPSLTVISSTTKFTAGTAGEACQLWFESSK